MKAKNGQIHLTHQSGKKIELLKYKELNTNKTPALNELFIGQFQHYGFSQEEMKLLSLKHRRTILYFKETHNHNFAKNIEILVKKINAQKEKNLIIEAQDLGANIVYAALFSGKIDPLKTFDLKFTDSPLALIPEAFYKCLKPKKLSLQLSITPESWMNEIKSIAKPTTHQLIKKLQVA